MPTVSTSLWFDSQALEAAQFYTDLVPGSGITSVTRDPGGNPHTTGHNEPGKVLHVEFHLGDQRFGAVNGGPVFSLDEAVSITLSCTDQEEADGFWDGIVDAGGAPSMCGWITDQFGLSWQVVPQPVLDLQSDPDSERARRAVQAMLLMRRLDAELMRRVAFGPDAYGLTTGSGSHQQVFEDPRREHTESAAWFDASPERVWEVVSQPGWFVNSGDITAHTIRSEDGQHHVTDHTLGTFVVSDAGVEPGRYIAHRWEESSPEMQDDSGLHTTVAVWLYPHQGGTFVVVVESFFQDAALAPERLESVYADNVQGWRIEMDALARHLTDEARGETAPTASGEAEPTSRANPQEQP